MKQRMGITEFSNDGYHKECALLFLDHIGQTALLRGRILIRPKRKGRALRMLAKAFGAVELARSPWCECVGPEITDQLQYLCRADFYVFNQHLEKDKLRNSRQPRCMIRLMPVIREFQAAVEFGRKLRAADFQRLTQSAEAALGHAIVEEITHTIAIATPKLIGLPSGLLNHSRK